MPPQSCRVTCEHNRASKVILDAIKDLLSSFLEALDRQAVMQKVWWDPYTIANVLKKLKFSKDVVLQGQLLNDVRQSLEEVRCPRSARELATKHAILTAFVTSSYNSLASQMGRLLKVHPRNLSKASTRRSSMESQPQLQWTISKRNLRVDILSTTTKAIVYNNIESYII